MPTPKRHHRPKPRAKMPKGVKYVGEPSKWVSVHPQSKMMPRNIVLLRHKEETLVYLGIDPQFLEPLRGIDLSCHHKLDELCEVDTLIELANRPKKIA